jgi:hypothetical protein
VQEVEGEPDQVVLALSPEHPEVDRRWREQLLERAWEDLDGPWSAGSRGHGRTSRRPSRSRPGCCSSSTPTDFSGSSNARTAWPRRREGMASSSSASVEAYRQLVSVKRAVRILESFLRIRPVFRFWRTTSPASGPGRPGGAGDTPCGRLPAAGTDLSADPDVRPPNPGRARGAQLARLPAPQAAHRLTRQPALELNVVAHPSGSNSDSRTVVIVRLRAGGRRSGSLRHTAQGGWP